MEQLAEEQNQLGADIQKLAINFKKDSATRKTTREYFNTRLDSLESIWTTFDQTDTEIRDLEPLDMDHEYFTSQYYEKIKGVYSNLKNDLEDGAANIDRSTTSSTHKQTNIQGADKVHQAGTSGTQQAPPGNNSTIIGLMRRQKALITSLKRLMGSSATEESPNQTLTAVERLWQYIEGCHLDICQTSANPSTEGYDMEEYLNLEEEIFRLKTRLGKQNLESSIQSNEPVPTFSTPARVQLPKIATPKFDGDYLKWQPFSDIFTKMIHEQPLPPIQKMWYLKTSLSGEAERLIRHLELTEGNYSTAWRTLQDRYANKRVLTSTIIDKFLCWPNVTSDARSLKEFHDVLNESLEALKTLGVDIGNWDPLLIHILIKKLDRQTHIVFEQSLANPKELPTIEQFQKVLQNRFQALEAVGGRERDKSKAVSTITASQNFGCQLCKGSHPLYYCKQFLSMTTSERLKWVQSKGLCVNCFKPDHKSKKCKFRSCAKCSSKHNTLLHLQKVSETSTQKGNETTSSNTRTVASANNKQGYILLATAMVKITANNGRSEMFRAILDSGSQINIVTERLVNKLDIKTTKTALSIDGIGGRSQSTTKRVNVELSSLTSRFTSRLEAFVLPSIVPAQPGKSFNISSWSIPDNIQLADPNLNTTAKIDVLIGAEFYFELMSAGEIRMSKNLPILRNTKLGWVASGRIANETTDPPVCAVYGQNEEIMSQTVQRFWEIDDVGLDTAQTVAEQKCEDYFQQTTIRRPDGRFVVQLPFADDPSTLGESKGMAMSRFLSLERRLSRDPVLQDQYIQFMKEYENLGHMTPINPKSIQGAHYYIPHHCVLRPESSTTKLRVVFDASAKTSTGQSLNDILSIGPKVQDDLVGILLRFRLPRFVFTTDIEKMYRQIMVNEKNRMFQLIFWRNTPNEPIRHYNLNTVTYGTSSAPYLATKCLQQLAEANIEHFPLGATVLKNDFYVDDGMSGSDSLVNALEMQEQLTELLDGAGFKLRKWCANHHRLLQGIPPQDQEVDINFENASTKVLGLTWTPKTDHFCLKAKIQPMLSITKRSVVSDVSRIFDPLGIAGPVVVAAKIFIQDLWKMKFSWDERLPEEIEKKWIKFRESLSSLNNCQVPRHMFNGQKSRSTQIHIFADASEKAYGAAVYLRAHLEDGSIIIRLLCAKSRVAPLQNITLPRLELCAALLGAKLGAKVKRELRYNDKATFFWTDSEIVLHWIHSTSSSLRTFVANRVSKIQDLTTNTQWRHVGTKDNPADLISRGVSPDKLFGSNIWFYGPPFLHGKDSIWPKPFVKETQPDNVEFKQTSASATAAEAGELDDMIYKINHRNSFRRLQRILAYIIRFVEKLKCRKNTGTNSSGISLGPREMDMSLRIIVRSIQNSDFKKEIQQLQRSKSIDKSSPINSLCPFVDKEHILRTGGRLEASQLTYDAKHPMILPYNDPIVKLLLDMLHRDNHHCGPQLLLATSRQRFWIVKGKTMTRNIVQNCVRCTRAKPKFLEQIMGNLPASRVTPARPFITTGVDYCGPFWIHYKSRGKRPNKAYLAIFCCFATKAVHLELVSDLSTEAFIGALKRFIGRRGRCQNIYSDNATNFVGAKNQLTELSTSIYSSEGQEKIVSTCSERGIQFHFIPPRAPHFGGLWEAAVKSAKHFLTRSVAPASLTYEELETIIIEVEAILNSRPLTPISTDPRDLTALTPGHFLIGEALTTSVDNQAKQMKLSSLTHWKLVSQLKHDFWRRWSNEYLNELQQRHKWKDQKDNIRCGDMVIIKEDNVPVMQWPLGRIVNLYQGKDGIIRVVDVKTATGIFKRPIHRLALLPVDTNTHQNMIASNTGATVASDTRAPPPYSNSQPNTTKSDIATTDIDISNSDHVCESAKRRRMSSLSLCYTLLASLLLLTVTSASPITNTRFGSKLGIHFEEMGSVVLSTTNWNLFVYYDLTAYWEETSALLNTTSSLQQLCQQIRRNSPCSKIIEHLEQLEDELRLDNRLLHKERFKRGAVDFVGNIAHSLFGVLDSEYAKDMATTILEVKENESFAMRLLKNQTSIIDSTINILKENLMTTKTKFDHLRSEIDNITNNILAIDEELLQVQITQLLHSGFIQLTLVANKLQRMQTSIVDALTDTHHNKISPLLLTPTQLHKEMDKIMVHLPRSLNLPVAEQEILQLYKIMKVKGALTENHAVFHVTIPLIENNTFKLYNLIPVPNWLNNSMKKINPCSSTLAINQQRGQYFPLNKEDLRACDVIQQNRLLCYNINIRYNFGAEMCACELNLFNNNTSPTCNLQSINSNSIWIQLNQHNRWIYATSSCSQATIVCENEIIPTNLTESGLLTLQPDCVLKHNWILIRGQQLFNSTVNSSYTSLGKISDLYNPPTERPLVKTITPTKSLSESKDAKHVEELEALQQALEHARISELPQQLDTHKYHSYAVSYTALALCIVVIAAIFKLQRQQRSANSKSESTPRDPVPSLDSTRPEDLNMEPQAAPRQRFTINL